ncbi:MAG: ATP-dependent RecD-like DNA helicase [Pseudomonadota bacterium]
MANFPPELNQEPAPQDQPLPAPPEEVLEGVLERITVCKETTSWTVGKLMVEDPKASRRQVTVVGILPAVLPGEGLSLTGVWVTDPKFGLQFRVSSFVTSKPATLVGIEKYLKSGLLKGMGGQVADALLAHFGENTLEILDNSWERLLEVKGIGRVRADRIMESWAEQRQLKGIMTFLLAHGVAPALATRIYKTYGTESIQKIHDNPYCLSEEVFGVGFKTADRIASGLGIPHESTKRLEAGVRYVLSLAASGPGHVFLPRHELVMLAVKELSISAEALEAFIQQLLFTGRGLVVEQTPIGEVVFLKGLYNAEVGAAARLRAILATEGPSFKRDIRERIEQFEASAGMKLATRQAEAVELAGKNKILVITGGPGTGKTTIIRTILGIMGQDVRVRLCAPTGRAAKRMEESTGREAQTLHRLLGYKPGAGFRHNQNNPLEADVVIVDEASMMDVSLFNHLLQALPGPCRLILVGDVDQLPSVGPGLVLRDIIKSAAVPVVRLDEIFRQGQASRIVVNAHRVNRGEKLSLGGGTESDFFFLALEDPMEVLDLVKTLVSQRLPQSLGVDPVRDIQVLAPTRKNLLGVSNLNLELQALLNPHKEGAGEVKHGDQTFRAGDKVMQLRNDYEREVFNGDMGVVVGVSQKMSMLTVRFPGHDRPVVYKRIDLDDLVLAYASTVHKAQGGEHPVVVLVLHTQHHVMLQRNLLYTGMTRGRRLVVLVGSSKAVSRAIQNNKITERHTRLGARLTVPASSCSGSGGVPRIVGSLD